MDQSLARDRHGFRINQAEFVRGLRLAQSIADRKSTMPPLANVLLRVQSKSKLLVTATDLNVSLSAELKISGGSDGSLTVGAKALHDIVVNLPKVDDISFRKVENNWAEIKAGKVAYRIVGVPDRDFPKVPDHREAPFGDVDAATLREMIDRTLFSVCNDETRFHLNGVLFERPAPRRAWSRPTATGCRRSTATCPARPSCPPGSSSPRRACSRSRRSSTAPPPASSR
jgi:DNA polymerase-3 subunit beta